MAGTYPDVPGYRFAYDKDGSSLARSRTDNTGNIETLTNSEVVQLNNNLGANYSYDAYWWGSSHYLTIFFPELRLITGYYINYADASGVDVNHDIIETSADATTPQDGTWTSLIDPYSYSTGDTSPTYRSAMQIVNWPNVYCLRISAGRRPRTLHLYGSIATTESPDRLRIVDMSGDDIAAQFDFGNIRQRNNVTKQFKVVNNSSTKTANNITITWILTLTHPLA